MVSENHLWSLLSVEKRGEINDRIYDGIADGCHTESFDNKYTRWVSNLSDGQLSSVDGRLWQNDGSILNHTQGCCFLRAMM
jgi:hypothetical protein